MIHMHTFSRVAVEKNNETECTVSFALNIIRPSIFWGSNRFLFKLIQLACKQMSIWALRMAAKTGLQYTVDHVGTSFASVQKWPQNRSQST